MRHTARLLARRPGFSVVLLITLALGIGAPTAMFSVVYAVLLRPLPYPHADRIVRFRLESRGPRATVAFDALPVTTALSWAQSSATLAALSVYNDRSLTLTGPDGPTRLLGVAATPGLFQLLGVRPQIGQPFDAQTSDERQIVLSHEAWQRHLGGQPDAIDRAAVFDGEPFRIVGVMPPGFAFPSPETAFWVPLVLPPGGGRGMLLPAIARLAPEATTAAVVEEGTRLFDDFGESRQETTLIARTLQEQLVGSSRPVLLLVMAVVSVVSVIATVNIALLLLVRGAVRRREFSVRLAIGAGRRDLVRQLVMESLGIALIGGAAGVALAVALLRVLLRVAPADIPRLHDASIGVPVLLFAAALTLLTSVVFSVLSAGRIVSLDAVRALTASGPEPPSTGAATPRRSLAVLAAMEVALTIVLLSTAGLLIRTFVTLVLIDQGFDSRGAVAMQITLPAARYPGIEDRLAFHQRLLEHLQRVEGVEAAGLALMMPNRQPTGRFAFNPDGVPTPNDPATLQVAEVRSVTEGFIEAMGLRLIAGRGFDSSDTRGAEPVMVVSESLARRHFADTPAVGKLLHSGDGARRIIGVVADVKPASGEPAEPSAYLTLRQDPDALRWFATATIVARSRVSEALVPSLRAIVRSLDAEIAPFNVRTLDDEVWRLVARPRFSAAVVAGFALVGLVLAAVGVFGVMSYAMTARTREIGVRIALGATRGRVCWEVMRDGVLTVAAGIVCGLVGSLWTTQLLVGLLADVPPRDPVALVAVTMLLAGVALASAYIPAHRATRISAVDALRTD